MADLTIKIKRDFCIRHVQALSNLINKKDPTLIDDISFQFQRLDEHAKAFENSHAQLMSLDENQAKQTELWAEFDQFFSEVSKIRLICNKPPYKVDEPADSSIANQSFLNTAMNMTSASNQSVNYKRLPTLTIPTFSGDLASWSHFADLFKNLVHQNETLSDIEKFQYLKLNLTCEPLSLVKNLLVNSDNYAAAWKLLERRYDNPRLIATHHVNRILELPQNSTLSLPALKSLVNTLNENVAALETLKLPVSSWSFLLTVIVLGKLDYETRRRFELTLEDHRAYPTFSNLTNFLENQISVFESLSGSKAPIEKPVKPQTFSHVKPRPSRTFMTHNQPSCIICQGNHSIFRCQQFEKKSTIQRREFVKNNKLCFNCLRSSHSVNSCPSSYSCRLCKARHHSLLHITAQNDVTGDQTINSREERTIAPPMANSFTLTRGSKPLAPPCGTVLLATARAELLDPFGKRHVIRMLLDCGSQTSYITNACVKRTRLRSRRLDTPIYSLGGVQLQTARGIASCRIYPQSQMSPYFDTSAIIVDNITDNMPMHSFDVNQFSYLKTLQLADPQVDAPASVDMLLGADLFAHILLGRRVQGPAGLPTALETVFGWVLLGEVPTTPVTPVNTYHLSLDATSIDNTLRKFWEIEEIAPTSAPLTPEENHCENLYNESVKRDATGRYSVALPFREFPPALGDSYRTALQNLRSLQRRLDANAELKKDYLNFMNEYLQNGHMSPMPDINLNQAHYFIPHHCVLRPDSLTTKLRVVFNGSKCTSNGKSLNDVLLPGKPLQQDMLSIISRVRFHAIVLTADIRKMYRQINIHSEHRTFQQILWSFDFNKRPTAYMLNTVTYGLNCAPFLALRTLLQLAEDDGHRYPAAARVIREDTYVDDVITGCDSVTEAIILQKEISELFNCGAFELRKWASNEPKVLASIPISHRQLNDGDLELDRDKTIKVLGLCWNPSADFFHYKITPLQRECTKRIILSEVARIFDPLGWLAPLTMFAKRMIQILWSLSIGWDAEPPSEITSRWKLFQQQIVCLKSLRIPRYIPSSKTFDLVGFCDASESGYAAVIYSRSVSNDQPCIISLLSAKTRVAPLKRISLARLELCAALLLARLIKSTIEIFSNNIRTVYTWSDSTVTLAWVCSPPHRWKTFVSNRVTEIQATIDPASWRHVPSQENPADCASRGLLPTELVEQHIWWHGPAWLSLSAEFWPTQPHTVDVSNISDVLESERKNLTLVTTNDNAFTLLNKYSSLSQLQRTTAYCLRFFNRCRKKEPLPSAHLTARELQDALTVWIKLEQLAHFAIELNLLQNKRSCKKQLQKLSPFLDENGLIRVGGRMKHAPLSYDTRHPILLPPRSNLTKLIIDHYHAKYLHPGPQTLHAILTQNYWIISARNVIRHRLSYCKVCFRCEPRPAVVPLMGNLPADRITRVKPFQVVGLDFGGPFKITFSCARGIQSQKAYLCLFVCFTTKALHLELVTSLSTDAFLAALRRFIARRGRCNVIHSDCGTNFVGAKRQLRDLFALTKSKDFNHAVASSAAELGIEWRLNPPSAPHFGGLWEAGIKSVKKHLLRVIGEQILTYEEFSTVLADIEALLNSRPLCPLSSDPNDLTALTPGHFLIQEPPVSLPNPDLTSINLNRLSRWQLTVQIQQHFWNRWHREYLNTLQQRSKWLKATPPMTIDTLVVIKDELEPPIRWRLGRITAVSPGSDGVIRVATVTTASGVLKRPVAKLCVLPINPD